ncbi:MAG: outer membrane beta-barrel protein [Psychroflexus sp.]|nr:outer membrane beta-barrel protein [Psychroflexus sp.]MDR9448178.1 outer membrane beta-barrel protein [Psychroflexus sp.]
MTCLLLTSVLSAQQEISIKGYVKDSISQQPLPSSTVFIETIADSTLISYSITDQDGFFDIREYVKDSVLRLNISYTGMKPYQKKINIKSSPLDMGTIYLSSQVGKLDEVVLNVKRSPIVVKKDTLEFNAQSFKTQDGANLEALLDKLPGLQIDKEGNITVNGKPVERILVNGKSFFGDDPKIALKNLPKSIIDKIQVVDTKTKEEEFTGEDGDDENKTINVTIDKDKNKGFFSRATISGGTDNRYAMSGIANYFKDDVRISIIGGSNNINSPGFTFDEVFDMMGSVRSVTRSSGGGFGLNGINFGGGSGITKSDNAGLSYVDSWSNDHELESNYFFGGSKTRNEVSTRRENILPDRSFFTNSNNQSVNRSQSHRANVNYSVELDTLTRISFRPQMLYTNGNSQSSRNSSSTDADRDLINQLSTENQSDFDNVSWNSNLTFTRRFKQEGTYLRLRFQNAHDDNERISFFNSTREIFDEDTETQVQDQQIIDASKSNSYIINGRFRNLIKKHLYYTINYNYKTSDNESIRNVFDFNNTTDAFSDLNEDLSNTFTTRSNKHIPRAGLKYDDDTLRIEGQLGLNRIDLKTDNEIQNVSFTNNFNILSYNTRFSYRFTRSKRISLRLRNSTNIPSVSQLQPVSIQTDPLNIVEGNPDLNASIDHRVNLNFYDFSYDSGSSYSVYMSYSFTEDQVVSVVNTDEDLVRTRTYTNLSGNQQLSLYLRYSKNLKKSKNQNDPESMRISARLNNNYSKNLGFSNDRLFRSERYVISPSLNFYYELEDMFTLDPSFDISYNLTQYNLNQNQNQEFINYNFGLEAVTYWPENVIFGNDITFTQFGNVNPDFDNTSWLWNVSLGYTFADDRAIVKVKAYDLLNQNINTQRQTGDDFIQDTQQLILRQYFMLSFTYKFKKFGGKDPNRRNMKIF